MASVSCFEEYFTLFRGIVPINRWLSLVPHGLKVNEVSKKCDDEYESVVFWVLLRRIQNVATFWVVVNCKSRRRIYIFCKYVEEVYA